MRQNTGNNMVAINRQHDGDTFDKIYPVHPTALMSYFACGHFMVLHIYCPSVQLQRPRHGEISHARSATWAKFQPSRPPCFQHKPNHLPLGIARISLGILFLPARKGSSMRLKNLYSWDWSNVATFSNDSSFRSNMMIG
jgi:hypothetical protein